MLLEFENELGEFRTLVQPERKPVVKTQPLGVGDKAPFFSLTGSATQWVPDFETEPLPGETLSILDLISRRPLVVSFYCPCWGRYARPYLENLVKLSGYLRAVGATLLVFSNEPIKSLVRQFPELDFMVAYDADFSIARRFGVYSEEDPIWDRVSGISEEVFTPALYVIGPNRQISYRFLDEDFDQALDLDGVVGAAEKLQVQA